MTNERAIEQLKNQIAPNAENASIEAIGLAILALEHRTAKKPISLKADKDIKIGTGTWKKGVTVYKCPCCNSFISQSSDFCNKCGQAIDRT